MIRLELPVRRTRGLETNEDIYDVVKEDMMLVGVSEEDAEDESWMEADDLPWRPLKGKSEMKRKQDTFIFIRALQ